MLVILKRPFFGEWKDERFDHFSFVYCLYTELYIRRYMLSKSLVLHTPARIWWSAAFLLLIRFSSASSSTPINFLCLMYSELSIFFFSYVYQRFKEGSHARFIKCFSPWWHLSSPLTTFNILHELYFFPPCKSRTTSTNIHSATMWGYRMLSRRPAWGDER